jgi:AraC-like DNA-binding protein
MGLFAGVAVLNLGYHHGVAASHFGAPSAAAELLRHCLTPLALGCYALLLHYGLRALDGAQARGGRTSLGLARASKQPRTLLLVLLLGFGLGLSFVALDAWFGPFPYSESWYALGVRAGLVFGLAVVGLQASYAQVQPLPLVGTWQRAGRGLGPALWNRTLAPRPQEVAQPPVTTAPVADSPLVLAPELLPWCARLLALMNDDQPWREPELTLGELAQRLQVHPALLSKVINQGCGQNFNDFVNAYRVAEARRKLADPRFAHYSLVGVALESGFNSKSTFNRVFKKLTGQAPGELARPKL